MSNTSEDSTLEDRAIDGAADFLFPLTSRHTRTDAVTAELIALSHLPTGQVVVRAKETSRDRRLAHETLVAVVRGFLRSGNIQASDAALTALIDRLRPLVKVRALQWSALFAADVEDAVEDALLTLIGYIRSTDAGQEFWECNFAYGFKFRLSDAFKHAARQRRKTQSLTTEWADGKERDQGDDLPDTASETAFEDIETQQMVQAITQAVPGFAEYYTLHRLGYNDKEIAAKMGVADRTLRNWKDRAKTLLTTLGTRP